ncbi:MAG: taurine dioxygenase [Verrucomicrobiales bacterium]|jgi:taurine dioxygenase
MKVTSLSDGVGVEVHDLQLSKLTSTEADLVNETWAEHGLLVFGDQELTEQEHTDLALKLGEIDVNRFFSNVEGFDEIADVLKEPTDELNIGGGWHTDHSYDIAPARGSILVARDLPPVGGDTRFLSTQRAWETLAPELKDRVSDLDAVHSSAHIFGPESAYAKKVGERFDNRHDVRLEDTIHPVVVAHPATGVPSLFINPGFTIRLLGPGDEDANKELFDTLLLHIARHEHTFQFAWQPGSVAMWDNRSTWHWALNDYEGHRRQMHRITLAGETLSRSHVRGAASQE